jgi:flagellar basal-body rod modification protein FlgD
MHQQKNDQTAGKGPNNKDAGKRRRRREGQGESMAAAAGILNHSTSSADLTGTTVKADADSSSNSASITSSDFLVLLVTELKNQDPTASTDPNAYVNQLISINSLEQLININSTLTSAVGGSISTTSSGTNASASATANSDTAQPDASSGGSSISDAIQTATSELAPGNLSVPAANPSAQTVAQALSGRRNSL